MIKNGRLICPQSNLNEVTYIRVSPEQTLFLMNEQMIQSESSTLIGGYVDPL